MYTDSIYTTPQPITLDVVKSFQNAGGSSQAVSGFEAALSRASSELETEAGGAGTWYVNLEGYARDPGSACNWSQTPKAGFVAAVPTGRGVAAKFDKNAAFIPEFELSNGQLIMGMDRGEGDGSTTMKRIYG